MEPGRKCAAYVCAKEMHPPTARQLKWVAEFSEKHELDVVEVYQDEPLVTIDSNGFALRGVHPAFDRMAEDAKSGKFESILVEGIEFLNPSTSSDLGWLIGELEETDVTVITRFRELSFAKDGDVLCLCPDFIRSSRDLEEIWQSVVDSEARHDPPLWAEYPSKLHRRLPEE